ncbi:probable cadmium zinc-transporting ATPase HMA1, chloroplastic [Olea europaea subsp. europaea]|uniref:Probable cadmium zinc-transporting ATPase HMA1, chloroplastic n=1 Tax=Olea europaea subsp. europaea TaxID=158383 RepID=A0A8S0QDS5_OLEEU|nr:probable cadmium zinc-transporting ATPase HMA1, chloroplastic [Olea europaea subsp. europaea]
METLHLPTSLIILRNPSLYRTTRIKLKVDQNFRNRHTSIRSLDATPHFPIIKCSTHHDRDHDHHHHHHHDGPSNDECAVGLTKFQGTFLSFAKAVKWTYLANFLREHLELCCCSAALFLAAAACPYLIPKPAVKPLQQAFTLIAFPLVGVSALFDAVMDITSGKINIHVLMALAAFASVFMGNALEGGLLLAMFNLAHIAEEYFTGQSRIDVKELKENHPESALVLDVKKGKLPSFSDLKYHEVPVNDMEVGSYILVKAGESVPVDCEVFQGRSTITIEHLTGEVKPIEKKVGDSIPGGARNIDGVMIVKATKTWKESMLSRIVQLTEEAQLSKPRLQRWLDKFGDHYSKAVVVLSFAVALMGPLLFKWPFFSTSVCRGSFYRALGLMVAASPCALAVAPLAYATAISACARKGILLKGGHVFDALASCHTIAFDKTGTLTTGEFTCIAIEPIHGHVSNSEKQIASCCVASCEKEALAVAAALEKGTTHPIGRAVVNHSMGKDLPSVSVESFENLPGRGLFATISHIEPGLGDGKPLKASLGSVEYITSLLQSDDESKKIKEAVSTSSYGEEFVRAALSVNNKKVTLFHFEDKPRHGASDVIKALQDNGKLRVMMLTGDHESSAWRVGNAVGIKEVHCSLKPEDKLYHVTSIPRDTGGGLIMVGDGINDAPALAAATVGIVLAERASASAIAVADVMLVQDNISGIPFCVAKSRQTTSLVKQNVALALSSIFLASLTSVLGFLPLWLTVLLHEGGTLLVCLNSIRALHDPTWSWRHNIQTLVEKLKSLLLFKYRGTTQAAPL